MERLRRGRSAFTLIEVLIGVAVLTIAITALLGAFLGQVLVAQHARNLTWAMNDASRVMEQMRQQNTTPCIGGTLPSSNPPTGFASWDAWMASTAATGGGGKSIQPDPAVDELIVVTCRNEANTANCTGVDDPIRVTVAVCWRHRGRILGECVWNGALQSSDGSNSFTANSVIESQAMLSTLMTCRT